jgi:hypothetical protein
MRELNILLGGSKDRESSRRTRRGWTSKINNISLSLVRDIGLLVECGL